MFIILGPSISNDLYLIYWAIQFQESNLMDVLVNLTTLSHLNSIDSTIIWWHKKLHETNISLQNKQLRVLLISFTIVQWLISKRRHQFSQDIKHMQHFIIINGRWRSQVGIQHADDSLLCNMQVFVSRNCILIASKTAAWWHHYGMCYIGLHWIHFWYYSNTNMLQYQHQLCLEVFSGWD